MPGSQASACVCVSLRNASRSLTKLYDDALAPSGLLLTQYSLLQKVSASDEMTLGELASAVDMDQSTVTRTIRPLVRDGLVRMTSRADDRRTRVASLTARGRAALAKAVPLWRNAQHAVIARLGDERWESLRDALGALGG